MSWRATEEVLFSVKLYYLEEYDVADIPAMVGECGGRMLDRDEKYSDRPDWGPTGCYNIKSDAWHVWVELPPGNAMITGLMIATGGFVGSDGESVVCGVTTHRADDSEPWEKDPDEWKRDTNSDSDLPF